jgi:hypothetical protein
MYTIKNLQINNAGPVMNMVIWFTGALNIREILIINGSDERFI